VLVTLAIEQAIHATLQPCPQGLKQHGDDARRDQRDQQIATGADARAERADHQYVHSHYADGEDAID
jgi:hypothetical protein